MWAVAAGGLLALIGLSLIIGSFVDRQARDSAWGRIADSRRINGDNRRENEEKALELDVLDAAAELRERRLEFREQRLLTWEEELRRLERLEEEPPSLTA